MIELLGYLASAGAVSMWLPQAWRVLRLRHSQSALAGISLTGYSIAVVFNALLLAYGLGTHSIPVALAGGVNLVLTALIVTTVGLARQA